MSSISETGHTKNVKKFLSLIGFIEGWGVDYKPTNPLLGLASVKAFYHTCEAIEKEAREEEKIFDDLVDKRQIVFTPLQPFSTRVYNSFISLDIAQETKDGALEINRKLQGKRAKTIKEDKTLITESETPKPKTVSVSQQSFDSQIKNLEDLKSWVALYPVYNPNETELKVASIETFIQSLHKANNDVIAGIVPYDNKLNERDRILYGDKTGMLDIALAIKKYALGAFGAKSVKYKQISGIEFIKMPRKDKNLAKKKSK
jgi:hypothetical protein